MENEIYLEDIENEIHKEILIKEITEILQNLDVEGLTILKDLVILMEKSTLDS